MKGSRDIKDTSGLKPITDIKEIQQIEKGILERVATFCEERGIRYSLAYGTLLGAIRHKGFIPWDDDVDVLMPRPDYERFCKEFSAEGLSLHNMDNDENFPYLLSRVYDDRTVQKDSFHPQLDASVCIDIYALDGFPSKKKAYIALAWRRAIYASYMSKYMPDLNWQPGHKNLSFKVGFLVLKTLSCVLPLSKHFLLSTLHKRMTRYGYDNQPILGNINWGVGKKDVMLRSWCENFVDVEFEGRQYKAFSGWDDWLSFRYGDYMTPPPEKNRVGGHVFKAWWK